jgi:hypothetical protein
MQGHWANRAPYYRCRFPVEYALANRLEHPRNVTLRQDALLRPLDEWLAVKFGARYLPATIDELIAAAAVPEVAAGPADKHEAELADGMIVAASTTLLAESRSGSRGGFLPWGLLVAGSVASLAANVAVAEPTATGRVIAAWPSFALIASYELLMRQVRRAAEAGTSRQRSGVIGGRPGCAGASSAECPAGARPAAGERSARRGREAQVLARQWALANRAGDGSLPSGRDIGSHCGRHERWVRLVKRSGLAGQLEPPT